jgi:exodeoxyribonuclease VII small subunit
MATPEPPKSPDDDGNVAAVRFDDLLGRLRALVEKLEGGNLSLEESLKSFEEGMGLCQKAAGVLDRAEKKVEILVSTPGGGAREEAFADAPPASGKAPESDDVPF